MLSKCAWVLLLLRCSFHVCWWWSFCCFSFFWFSFYKTTNSKPTRVQKLFRNTHTHTYAHEIQEKWRKLCSWKSEQTHTEEQLMLTHTLVAIHICEIWISTQGHESRRKLNWEKNLNKTNTITTNTNTFTYCTFVVNKTSRIATISYWNFFNFFYFLFLLFFYLKNNQILSFLQFTNTH